MKKNKIKIAIDSPAGSGAGTQAKLISKEYNLLYLVSYQSNIFYKCFIDDIAVETIFHYTIKYN